jgi:hypothetical protein
MSLRYGWGADVAGDWVMVRFLLIFYLRTVIDGEGGLRPAAQL